MARQTRKRETKSNMSRRPKRLDWLETITESSGKERLTWGIGNPQQWTQHWMNEWRQNYGIPIWREPPHLHVCLSELLVNRKQARYVVQNHGACLRDLCVRRWCGAATCRSGVGRVNRVPVLLVSAAPRLGTFLHPRLAAISVFLRIRVEKKNTIVLWRYESSCRGRPRIACTSLQADKISFVNEMPGRYTVQRNLASACPLNAKSTNIFVQHKQYYPHKNNSASALVRGR